MALMGVWKAKQAACAACLLVCLVQKVSAKLTLDISFTITNYHKARHSLFAINAAFSILQVINAASVNDFLGSWRDIACLFATHEEHIAVLWVGDKLQRSIL